MYPHNYLIVRRRHHGVDPALYLEWVHTEWFWSRNEVMMPYDADLIHPLFLYYMALNGIRVVRELLP